MFQRVLVLAPHTDDGEFGCGGAINKFLTQGKDVFYVAFSTADKSVPQGFPRDILKVEVARATEVLGIPPANLIVFDFAVRELPAYRQDILESMVALKKDIKPDLVFLPSLEDLHQDHQTVAMEGVRAFKGTTLLGYEEPWNNLVFRSSCFVALEEANLDAKLKALACYESQAWRPYAEESFIRSLAKTRGTQIGVPLAEAFETIRLFIK